MINPSDDGCYTSFEYLVIIESMPLDYAESTRHTDAADATAELEDPRKAVYCDNAVLLTGRACTLSLRRSSGCCRNRLLLFQRKQKECIPGVMIDRRKSPIAPCSTRMSQFKCSAAACNPRDTRHHDFRCPVCHIMPTVCHI